MRHIRRAQRQLAVDADARLSEKGLLFSAEPDRSLPRYPDTGSRAFTKAQIAAELPADLWLHSLRHFQAMASDAVIPERQRQARLGWSTVHMARQYTDPISSEYQRAAEHIGRLLDDHPN